MAKSKDKRKRSTWACTACGEQTRGWFGRCPSCGAWNTIEERAAVTDGAGRVQMGGAGPQPATAIDDAASCARTPVGLPEVDRVLGGGLVPGSVVLLGGSPGIGKSTLLLQAAGSLARHTGPVLYASGEESAPQVAERARRLQVANACLLVLSETCCEEILAATEGVPELAAIIVDSIQTVHSRAQDGLPGNLSQIRAVLGQLTGLAKSRHVPVIVVGHVTKDGQLAGPRLLEHMVDVVLTFEGDEERATRLLRASKNRFGSTRELGVFEMTGLGLRPVENPSEAFLGQTRAAAPGACITAVVDGSRPLLLEIQALLAPGPGGSPRRTCTGVDPNRVAMLLAVLERHGGLCVLDQDVFVNVAGGLRVREPAADLAVLIAVASSQLGRPLDPHTVVFGEVGLTGELRPVPGLDLRLAEAARLGFRRAVCPAPTAGPPPAPDGMEVLLPRTVAQALEYLP